MNKFLKKDKNILIIGLGLIGGSYAMALSKKGYNVYAFDINAESISFAKEKGYIKDGAEYDSDMMSKADIIIISLYPSLITEYAKKHISDIKQGAIITDVCGVKRAHTEIMQEICGEKAEFIASHPMAGRELCGALNADDSIFSGANFIVTPTTKNSSEAVAFGYELGTTLGFARVSVLSPLEHDKMIGYLSQLTHVIAVALMIANGNENLYKFTGDSFRDLTRIARINAPLWNELFLANKDILIPEIDSFIGAVEKIKGLIASDDKEQLIEIFSKSTERRALFDKPSK